MAESRTTPAGSEALKAGRGHRTPAERGWNPLRLACRAPGQPLPRASKHRSGYRSEGRGLESTNASWCPSHPQRLDMLLPPSLKSQECRDGESAPLLPGVIVNDVFHHSLAL